MLFLFWLNLFVYHWSFINMICRRGKIVDITLSSTMDVRCATSHCYSNGTILLIRFAFLNSYRALGIHNLLFEEY